jgi:hypothetical protein
VACFDITAAQLEYFDLTGQPHCIGGSRECYFRCSQRTQGRVRRNRRQSRVISPLSRIIVLSKRASRRAKDFVSAEGAWRTIEGYEATHAIRKAQIRWIGKVDTVAQRQFIHTIFGIAA